MGRLRQVVVDCEQPSSLARFRFGQDLVRALLREQHPDLADLELRDVAGGWDKQQWRLGVDLAVRWEPAGRAALERAA
jgi:hypothetical protein